MKSCKISSTDEQSLLETLSFLRFPLIVCVVLCHSFISSAMANVEVECFAKSSFLLSKIVARVAVPNFLLISGYLFFRNIESFTPRLYCDKLKRRLRSVVIPYIFWNAVVILLYFVGQSLVPQLFSGENTRVCDYTPLEWVKAFWRVDGTISPINPPLWYVRNLLVMVVLSPLVYLLLKNRVVGVLFIATMLCLWLSCLPLNRALIWLFPKFIFFFSLGAWFAIHKVAVPKFRIGVFAVGLLLYVLAIAVVFVGRGVMDNIAYEVAILVGSMLVMYLANYLAGSRGWRVPVWLGSSYFFIFVYHYVPLALLQRLALRFFKPTTDVEFFAIYFSTFAVILLLGVGLFHLLKRLLPKFTAFILGSRA